VVRSCIRAVVVRGEGVSFSAGLPMFTKRVFPDEEVQAAILAAARGATPIPPKDDDMNRIDLDAALARRPALLPVDELAHSNAPGSRHPKRWQDVDELLARLDLADVFIEQLGPQCTLERLFMGRGRRSRQDPLGRRRKVVSLDAHAVSLTWPGP
jgi:hypothetical protein